MTITTRRDRRGSCASVTTSSTAMSALDATHALSTACLDIRDQVVTRSGASRDVVLEYFLILKITAPIDTHTSPTKGHSSG